MNVRVELKDNIYVVYDNETNEAIDRSPNELSLRLLCQVRGWSLVNPPKRRKHRALLRHAREGS